LKNDAIATPFRNLVIPEQIENLSPLFPDNESSESTIAPRRRRRPRKPKVDPCNPDYEDLDEADEGLPKDSALLSHLEIPPADPYRDFDQHYSAYGSLWSDKIQLTVAMMKSIVSEQGIDIYSIVDEHVYALTDALHDGSLSSWPHTTRISIQSIAISNSLSESEVREREFLESKSVIPPSSAHITYFTSGNDSCLSDGFLPKLAPVAMYYATRDFESYTRDRKDWELERIISITHTHPLAYVCGITYSTFIERLLRLEDIEEVGDYVFRQILLMELFSLSVDLESRYGEDGNHLSKTISWIVSNTESLEASDLMKRCQHSSRLCVNTLSWTLGLFLLEGITGELMKLTRSWGMSSDARLSLTTSLFGCTAGRTNIRLPYVEKLSRLDEILEVAREFSAVLLLPTSTKPIDVTPAESLDYVESDDSLEWAAPHRPNGPLIADALWFYPTRWIGIRSFIDRFWRLTGLKNFLEWVSRPTPLMASALLLGINYCIYLGATSLINHGRRITAPEPPPYEHEIHQRHYPVFFPSTGGESRSYKLSRMEKAKSMKDWLMF
jgi:ADP-ribosylglycohydrolase